MISSLTRLGSHLTTARQSARELFEISIIAVRDDLGKLVGLRWPYRLNDQGLNRSAKRKGGAWTGNYWNFPTTEAANLLLARIQEKFPKLPLLEQTGAPDPEKGTEYSVTPVSEEIAACILSRKLSFFTSIPGVLTREPLFDFKPAAWPWPTNTPTPASPSTSHSPSVDVFLVNTDAAGLIVILAPHDTISRIVMGIAAAGATQQPALAQQFGTLSKVKISTSNWAVKVWIDMSNPRHWPLYTGGYAAERKDGWEKNSTTRQRWPTSWKKKIAEAGLDWEGDDPEAEDLSIPIAFDEKRVRGWDAPAPNGHLLHPYQQAGAQFCASRGMRALIGDEMGIGKTVQAIAAAEATMAPRIIVIGPANARYVWDREIRGWGGRGSIQHVESQLDTLDMAARWHILTYDLIAARSETWRLNDDGDVREFVQAFPEFIDEREVTDGQFPRKITLTQALAGVPKFADPKRIIAWENVMRRLRSELLCQILGAGPVLVILDEAHRVKNSDAKRTKAIKRITAGKVQVLMLTGTPLRNNEHEAAVLLSLLDADASKTLSTKNGYRVQDVKDYLGYFMIRRTKEEVLPDLPEKTRQRIDLDKLDADAMGQYHEAMAFAQRMYHDALGRGYSEASARQEMQGGIEKARTALGTAKILGGDVADLVLDVVENKGCCVVFCAHHNASDILKAQLEKADRKVAIIDGRVPQKQRSSIVAAFQEGRLDVVIGGINAAGEAITLTRADTVIFVELDWVPAALLQAEDRIHRVGQRSNCQVIQLVARLPGENLDEMMVELLGKKMIVIGAVLDEDASNIISASVASELHDLLLGKVAPAEEIPRAKSEYIVMAPEQSNSEISTAQIEAATDEPATEAVFQQPAVGIEQKVKQTRGRPKIYIDKAPPTSSERSKQSVKKLAAAGGKRVMLRLSPEAHEALKVIMAIMGDKHETAAINRALVARKNELLRTTSRD